VSPAAGGDTYTALAGLAHYARTIAADYRDRDPNPATVLHLTARLVTVAPAAGRVDPGAQVLIDQAADMVFALQEKYTARIASAAGPLMGAVAELLQSAAALIVEAEQDGAR
jgi:hypothetical protein